MREVTFKYDMDQRVLTPFSEGIITMLAVDDSGIMYYVKSAVNSQWYKEKELSPK